MPSPSSVSLYCFSYAGSSAARYGKWKRRLPSWVDVCPVELPGHGRRIGEPLETSIEGMVERLAHDLLPELNAPFAFFGHSMGSLVAFELAQRLHRERRPEPLVLFASGADAPSRRDTERYARITSDPDLKRELERLDGTPAAVLADADLMALTLPILRADFQACGRYRCLGDRRVGCPIHAFGGARDTTTLETLGAWRDHTHGLFSLDVLPGGHFFIFEQEAQLLGLMLARLSSLHGDPRPAHLPEPSRLGGAAEQAGGERSC